MCCRSCFNKLLNIIIGILIILAILYLVWYYPPWFAKIVSSLQSIHLSRQN